MNNHQLFSRIVWKNFLYHKKEFKTIILCEALVIAFSLIGVGCYQMLSVSYDEAYFLSEDGISKMFMTALIPFIISSIVMIITVMVAYFGKRMPDYVMFQRVGIDKKDMCGMILKEIVLSYAISLVLGFAVGTVMLWLIRWLIGKQLGSEVTLGMPSWWLYPVLAVVTLGLYLLGFLLLNELESDFGTITTTRETARKEPLYQRGNRVGLLAGVVLCVVSAYQYFHLYNYENIVWFICFLIGVYLMIRCGGTMFLKKRRNGKGYLQHLLDRNQLYYRSHTIFRYLFIFSVLFSCATFYFGIQLVSVQTAEPVESLFPYDFMCIADEEDEPFFQSLQEEYDLEYLEYPMVRVSNPDKTEGGDNNKLVQGQQIGISESTYHSLKKKLDPEYEEQDLGLDDNGEKVYIVHQQDRSVKAQPVDWYYGKKEPDLHVGVPCTGYVSGMSHGTFIARTIVGEEIGSLTGCYSQVKLENLIVFSDVYFEKAREEWKSVDAITSVPLDFAEEYFGSGEIIQGPTKLVFINAKEKDIDSIDARMEQLEERHMYVGNYDSLVKFHYSSKTAKSNMKLERLMKLVISALMMCLFVLMSMVFFYVKIQVEFKEKKYRADFLGKMGMPGREIIWMQNLQGT